MKASFIVFNKNSGVYEAKDTVGGEPLYVIPVPKILHKYMSSHGAPNRRDELKKIPTRQALEALEKLYSIERKHGRSNVFNATKRDIEFIRKHGSVQSAHKKTSAKRRSSKKRSAKRRSSKKRSVKKRSSKKRSAKKRSSKKRSAKRRSSKKRSAKRRSSKKASPKKRSAKRRSSKRRSAKRRSSKKRSVKRRSSKRRSAKK